MDRLAEAMANGCATPIDAAAKLRWTVAEAETLWKAIVRGLGWQAR